MKKIIFGMAFLVMASAALAAPPMGSMLQAYPELSVISIMIISGMVGYLITKNMGITITNKMAITLVAVFLSLGVFSVVQAEPIEMESGDVCSMIARTCNGNYVFEHYSNCNGQDVQYCEFGCWDGACNGPPSPEPEPEPQEQASCEPIARTCNGDNIFEHYSNCEGREIQHCPMGCWNGACNEPSTQPTPAEPTQTTCEATVRTCNGNNVFQHYSNCNGQDIETCQHGCSNGACNSAPVSSATGSGVQVELLSGDAAVCTTGSAGGMTQWVVRITNHGPYDTSVGMAVFRDPVAGCEATSAYGTDAAQISGQIEYPVGSSGTTTFAYDHDYTDCGRIQVDAFYRTPEGHRPIMIGQIVNYGNNCAPPPTPEPPASEPQAELPAPPAPFCGDGVINAGEQCDNGASNGQVCTAAYASSCSYCSAVCTLVNVAGPFCGDNIVQAPEQCDDGNTANGDACSSVCTLPPPPPGSISGLKFKDLNSNGIQDPGDQAMFGWIIFIDSNNNGLLDAGETNVTTDANGTYTFSGLAAGTYRIREVNQATWVQTTANPAPISLLAGQNVTNINFGNFHAGALNSISGLKFNDVNGNGIQDAGEGVLALWMISLEGPVTTSTMTDDTGFYEFTGLPGGTYKVCETMQSGWVQTLPTSGPLCPDGTFGYQISISDDTSSVNNNFGNRLPPSGSISGHKWEDINHNEIQDPGEGRVSGWTIFIDANNNGVLDAGETSTTTNANGEFAFSGLAPGVYLIREVMQPGWIQITDNPSAINLAAGQSVTGIIFGNQNTATVNLISGMKFNDTNGNGGRQAGEAGLAGWTIYLDQNLNGMLDAGEMSTITDASGNYLFTNMLPGTYHVREVQQSGWVQTSSNPSPITLSSGSIVLGVDFANQQPVPLNSIGGMKFNDLNGNGAMDADESGLAGWTITINGPATASTQTDADGTFEFTGLAPGTYTVCEVQQPSWTQTLPSSGASCATGFGYSVSLSGGTNTTGIDFANRQVIGSISGVKFKDLNANGVRDVTEPGMFGFTVYLDANNNGALDSAEQSAVSGANGNFTFSNLIGGTYTLREISQVGWVQTTANPATVTVGDGVTTIFVGNTPSISSISGFKFNDLNSNGVRDAGEPGLAGWTISLSGSASRNATTNADGYYTFAGLVPGFYFVSEVQQPGWTQTTPAPGMIFLMIGSNVNSVNFGNAATGAAASAQEQETSAPQEPTIVCADDMLQCSDGSWVARNDNCEFVCPVPAPPAGEGSVPDSAEGSGVSGGAGAVEPGGTGGSPATSETKIWAYNPTHEMCGQDWCISNGTQGNWEAITSDAVCMP